MVQNFRALIDLTVAGWKLAFPLFNIELTVVG